MNENNPLGLEQHVQSRRAIEALRAGVPNRDAVAALGSLQTTILERFATLLDRVRALPASGSAPGGLVIAGGFGTGKSHALEHLQHVALQRRNVVSKVVISKETPLHDPAKLLRAAVEAAVVPDKRGAALVELATALQFDSPAYAEFFKWAHDPGTGLNGRFPASLYLFEHLRTDDLEFVDLLVRFWAGDPIRVPDLRRRLREAGEASSYAFAGATERNLAPDRFRFVSRLVKAAGYDGWILLIDEVELVGRYSLLQRVKSYGEIAELVRGEAHDPAAPMAAVLAITDDFDAEVLTAKKDIAVVPDRLRAKQRADYDSIAGPAETGMRILQREPLPLQAPDESELDRTYELIKGLHGAAYGWAPADVTGLERLPSNRMRQYVRAWINEWDLRRLDPSYEPQIQITELGTDYSEDPDLEPRSDQGPMEPGD